MDWMQFLGHDAELYTGFLTSLAIGLFIGLERERKPSAKAGLRTFALVALLGALCAVLARDLDASWLVGVGLAVVGWMIIAAYTEDEGRREEDSGTTTIAAMLVCFALGAAVMLGFRRIAVMLAIATTALLYFKAELSGIAQRLERRDLISILQFAVLSLIVLPVLPDRDFGPYHALNLRNIWLMVVLISGISLVGYLALRIGTRQKSLPLLGVLGGLVSSTATTLVYARHAWENPAVSSSAAAVILIANLVVVGRMLVLAWVTAPLAIAHLLPPLLAALAAGGVGLVWFLRGLERKDQPPLPPGNNPTELRAALTFAGLYALVLVMVAWLNDLLGARGVYAVAVVSGLTDVDAITLSSLRLFGQDNLTAAQTVMSITLAFVANVAFKLGLVLFAGGASMFRRCALPMAAMAAAALLGLMLVK